MLVVAKQAAEPLDFGTGDGTLIELLAVMAIIGILAAIVVPAVVALTGLLTIPGFFVGMSLLGFAPSMASMGRTV